MAGQYSGGGGGDGHYRISDYVANPQNQGNKRPTSAVYRNQTGRDFEQMRRENSHNPYQNQEEANFSQLIARVDAAGEETKIMTFKSQDNGFFQPPGHGATDNLERANQTEMHNSGQYHPEHTVQQHTMDKRGSVNTLSQMTNPFRTKNFHYLSLIHI